ncbi:cupin domain-containing protein [Thalassotalea fonticola]|uniref:Cupin domain-containing protein n=1 Tax=Thalassotalea fonticola TaxID=3065649 RepID=A0ABZ0GQN1_9GAMM|nr:cupin domain-containing protein [Colwelliaceae bacterium S1-1]
MFELNLTEFNHQTFLRDYWQKKPVVIRQGFKNFVDPIDADEIAGLAGLSDVESRMVYRKDENWQAEFGPFDDFQRFGDNGWSLIVQALDHWSEEAAEMIEPFRFIPNWRLDDLMVSFATPGGGVGPHIDLYDVFICQGSGKRNWRVGELGNHVEFAAHDALLHVEPFESIIDTELLPGDILYIPPGFPHDGVTIDASLSFSVGFRANSTATMVNGLADHLTDKELAPQLLSDPQRVLSSNSGEINGNDFQLIKSQLQQLIDNEPLMRQFAGSFLSQAKHELDLQTDDEQYSNDVISELLQSNKLKRLGGLKAFYFSDSVAQGLFYINGEEHTVSADIIPAVKLLCDNVTVRHELMNDFANNENFISFLGEQLDVGYWYFGE